MSFSDKIKELRNDQSLTQKEFSEKIGLSTASVIAYERGDKKPSFEVLTKIAEVWNVSLDWLCDIPQQKNANRLRTVSDVIKCVSDICTCNVPVRIEHNEGRVSLTFERYPEGYDTEFIGETAITSFLVEYEDMLKLYRNGTITKELHDLWLDDKLKRFHDEKVG